jgi:Cu-Zn family superoxide dismutase
MKRILSLLLGAAACAALAACGKKSAIAGADAPAPADWAEISAPLIDSKERSVGTVAFRGAPNGVFMRIEAQGLTPGWHGVHVHQVADCSDAADGFKKSGGHFDPEDREHGLAQADGGERGDLPNLFADRRGRAIAEFFRSGVSLRPSEEAAAAVGPFPLLDDDGFSVVIHVGPDDHLSQPIGGAGARVACAAVKG